MAAAFKAIIRKAFIFNGLPKSTRRQADPYTAGESLTQVDFDTNSSNKKPGQGQCDSFEFEWIAKKAADRKKGPQTNKNKGNWSRETQKGTTGGSSLTEKSDVHLRTFMT